MANFLRDSPSTVSLRATKGSAAIPSVIRFGTDGWRGVIAEDFTFSNVRRVAHATAQFIQQNPSSSGGAVLIGFDRRFLSKEFADCVAHCLTRQGLRVRVSSAPLPTPALSVCVVNQKAGYGVMITASHNPAHYNGFKIKDGNGRSAPPEITDQIERLILASPPPPSSPTRGEDKAATFDHRPIYEAYVRSRLDWRALKRFPTRVILDHLHGVASGIPEKFLKTSPVHVASLHSEHDPLFGGIHPEPIPANLGFLRQEVRKQRALLGLAFDGDADRLGVVDDRGTYLTPHQVFPLLVLHCIESKGWRGKIVQSVSLGALGERIAKAYNLPFEEVPVGFKHIAERMLREDILAGGEESGGYVWRGGLPERDGILSGLFFLEMCASHRKSPSQLLKEMEKRFGPARFKRVDIPLKSAIQDKKAFSDQIMQRVPDKLLNCSVNEVRTLDGIKIVLDNGAWLLLRPSGTEPLLRTYAESSSSRQTNQLLRSARKWF